MGCLGSITCSVLQWNAGSKRSTVIINYPAKQLAISSKSESTKQGRTLYLPGCVGKRYLRRTLGIPVTKLTEKTALLFQTLFLNSETYYILMRVCHRDFFKYFITCSLFQAEILIAWGQKTWHQHDTRAMKPVWA